MKYLFPKGNKINLGRKQTEKWKKEHSERMKGNTYGFKKGHKINLGRSQKAWSKGKTVKTDNRIIAKEKHYNWKGGITPENKKIRNSTEMQYWRKQILIRDDFICQKYKVSGGTLCVHHINNFIEFPELRFVVDNGITLSEKAHREFHKLYGNRNNTKEQLKEFLNL